jgi:hypothetical protein
VVAAEVPGLLVGSRQLCCVTGGRVSVLSSAACLRDAMNSAVTLGGTSDG